MLKKSEHNTTIFNIKTPEFYINMKPESIPPRGHADRSAFVQNEMKKCIDGVNINGVFIPGSLYYDLNYHFIELDTDTGRTIGNPRLRDNGWIIHNDYCEAQKNKEHYCIGGGRQLGKSDVLTSLTMRELSIYDRTSAMLLFSNSEDKVTFSGKMKIAHDHLIDFLRVPLLDKDFNKSFLRFGFKETTNDSELHAKLYLLNTDGGNNAEIAASKTITFFAFDEIAKALRTSALLYTIDGTTTIGEVKIGDKIIDDSGNLTTVLDKFYHSQKEMYEITFQDNRKITCSGDHLWTVFDSLSKKEVTLTTREISEKDRYSQVDNRNGKIYKKNRYFLKKNELINYPEKEVLIDPYYMGLHLGDGHASSPLAVTCADQEILDYLKEFAIKNEHILKNTCRYTYRLSYKGSGKGKNSPISDSFKYYNLINNKHIPNDYLYNSEEIRLEFLRGFCDADGTVNKLGVIQVSQSNYKIIKQLEQLIRSLGIACSINKESSSGYRNTEGVYILCKPTWKITLHTNKKVFKLSRKLDRMLDKGKRGESFMKGTFIKTTIKQDTLEDCICIKVDNDSQLFLTDDLLVTHNSPFKESWDAAKPAFMGKFGFRNSGFFAFTGGNVERSKDAEKFFMNPKANKVYSVNGSGRFMDGTHRADLKKEGTFPEFLKYSKNIIVPENSELHLIPCEYVDVEEASKVLDAEAEEFLKSGENESYNKHRIYNPRKISDMFLKENGNPYSHLSSELEKVYEHILNEKYHEQTYELVEEFDKVRAIPLDKHYDPFSTNLNQPIVIIDHPRDLHAGKIYVAGLDPVNVDKTAKGGSRIAWTIMRKTTSDYSDPFQDTVVCFYNGRTDIADSREKLRLALKYYGAEQGAITLLHEAADDQWTQWFMDRKIGHWLENTYQLSKQIANNSRAHANKGLRPTTKNQNYGLGKLLEYLEEELPDGRMGLWRIKDILFLKQILKFEGDLSVCDSIVGNYHAIIHLYKERSYVTRVNEKKKVDAEAINASFDSAFGFKLKPKTYKRTLI